MAISLLTKVSTITAAAIIIPGGCVGGYYLLKSKTVGDSLNKEKDKFLSFDIRNTANHDAEWKEKVKKHKNEAEKPKLFEINLSSGSEASAEDIKALKKACFKLLNSKNNKSNIALFKKWCMKQ